MESIRSGICVGLALLVVSVAKAQTGGQQATGQAVRPVGVVRAVDAAQGKLTLRTDAGPEIQVEFDGQTRFLRVAPGEKSLEKAEAIAVADVAVGDRVLARGSLSADSKTLAAKAVIVMAEADLAKKREAERAEWERRGIGGVVKEIDPARREFTIEVPNLGNPRPVVVALEEGAVLKRYAPGSARFRDAKPAPFEEIQVGDQLRALGTRSEDGNRFTARQIVSGSFLVVAATVDAVHPDQNTLEVTDLLNRKKLQVKVSADSNLRRLPPELAQVLAMQRQGGAAPGGPPTRPAGAGERRGPPGAGARGEWASRGAGEGERPRSLQALLEKMPAITLADLNPGEAIAISSVGGEEPAELKAITLLAGVEPLLTDAEGGGRQMIGGWNLDLSPEPGGP
jgi:hypothetical protein